MKYNRSKIMRVAWTLFRKGIRSFSEALRMAWHNAKIVLMARKAAGVTEETHTWYGWKTLGYEVIHESKALFKAVINDPATKKGTRVTCYFGRSQVRLVEA